MTLGLLTLGWTPPSSGARQQVNVTCSVKADSMSDRICSSAAGIMGSNSNGGSFTISLQGTASNSPHCDTPMTDQDTVTVQCQATQAPLGFSLHPITACHDDDPIIAVLRSAPMTDSADMSSPAVLVPVSAAAYASSGAKLSDCIVTGDTAPPAAVAAVPASGEWCLVVLSGALVNLIPSN